MQQLTVSVQEDHLKRLIGAPQIGLTELIWNALDADANTITVSYNRNVMGGIDSVRVEDDGHGMSPAEIGQAFDRLGGSWKLMTMRTKGGRSLHGKKGEGRWRAFGIGPRIVWDTVAAVDGRHLRSRITMHSDAVRRADVDEPVETELPTGTIVTVEDITEAPPGLNDTLPPKLTARFALHLLKYPSVTVRVDGNTLDPRTLIDKMTDLPLQASGADLTIIEWRERIRDDTLYLCDPDGVSLAEVHGAAQVPTISYSAYLKSPLIREFEDALPLMASAPEAVTELVDAARHEIKQHLERRMAEHQRNVIDGWREEHVYPFVDAPTDELESVKRQLFEVVAFTASPAVNATKDLRSKRLSLRLLEQALEREPAELRRILEEVMRLPKEQVEQLDGLLRQTTLSSIVTASRKVADRLEFLRGLEFLLFDKKMKAALLERSQLHKMVRNEPWIFGEEFALAVDDKSLKEVLAQHLRYLGTEVSAADEPVTDVDGNVRVVDLMFSGSMEQARARREHLVVELKRPAVKLGSDEVVQIEKYALAVSADARFDTKNTEWDFWVVSDELDEYAKARANQDTLPPGMIHRTRGESVRIWAVTWGELIEKASHRLKFVQGQLNYMVTEESAVAYLRRAHQQFLPATLAG